VHHNHRINGILQHLLLGMPLAVLAIEIGRIRQGSAIPKRMAEIWGSDGPQTLLIFKQRIL